MAETDPSPFRIPVSVLVERRQVTVGMWTQPQWNVRAVVAGMRVVESSPECTPVSRERDCETWMWSGLVLELFRDVCEGYWYNLQSGRPSLFVICHLDEESEDPSGGLIPAIVTADQDEASAHLESDDPVFSVPMPDKVHQWVERFVVEHYRPEIKRKRRRRNWTQGQ